MKEKMQMITFWTVCIFLFCYFLRILNFPNELTVVFGGILCLVLLAQQKIIRIDLGICLLAIALASYYVIINGSAGMFYAILYIPLVVYELGNYMVRSSNGKENLNNKLLLLIFIMIVGYTIHGILNSYMWYAGYVVPGTRRWQDFWSGEIVPGTQHVAYFLPALAMFLPAVIYFKKRKVLNLLIIITSIFFIYTSLATRSRMSIVIFAIVLFAQIILYGLFERKNITKHLANKRFWLIGTVGLAAVVIIGIAVKDSAVMSAFIANLGKDGGILNNVRFQAQKLAVQQLFVYPMGGYRMDLGLISNAHNTWLDMANAAGVIPFFAFAAYTVYTLYELARVLTNNEVQIESKLMLTGVYGAFFLYLAVEPALEASIHLMTPWIFLNGVVHGYWCDLIKKYKAEK